MCFTLYVMYKYIYIYKIHILTNVFIQILEIIADLQKPEDCKRVVAETVSKFGQLDVLVNSAGILIAGSIETLSLEDYDKQMNINTRSVFITTQAAVPHLKATKGSIVNVSSVNGIRSVRQETLIKLPLFML